jgi:glycine/D-amino acid oxidase-like deaminating enzyme
MHADSCWTIPVVSAGFSAGPLDDDVTADVCVVGGGIAGLTSAYLLARSGLSVVLIEADALGHGETMRTSAHLASALDDRFHHLERWHGVRGARLAAESHAAAIDFIEAEVADHGVEWGFSRVYGYLFPH